MTQQRQSIQKELFLSRNNLDKQISLILGYFSIISIVRQQNTIKKR